MFNLEFCSRDLDGNYVYCYGKITKRDANAICKDLAARCPNAIFTVDKFAGVWCVKKVVNG